MPNFLDFDIKHKITGKILLVAGADLPGANLRGADLWEADLRDANLRDANLQGADLRYANLRDADLRDADLWGANLRDANLRDANLRGADLWGADLQGADLQGANLQGANLKILQADPWIAYIQKTHTRIGCQYHKNEDWKNFSDKEIKEMSAAALEYWNENKLSILALMDSLNKGDNKDA